MTNSRAKGANGEREVAQELFRELGVNFRRNLEQYQTSDHGDLSADDPDFPFLIEVKRRATGWTCAPAWEAQAIRAAQKVKKHPAIIYRYDRQKWRVRIYMDAVSEAIGNPKPSTQWVETNIQGFAWVAREIMARKAAK